MKKFLKARWENLIMINYEVPPDLLVPLVPLGTELDLWNGKAYVSVVAFLFNKTNVLSIPAIGNRKFPEVNLRMYLKRIVHPLNASGVEEKEVRRGVTFIKEIVPKPLVSFIANTFFNEHYETCKMQSGYPKSNLKGQVIESESFEYTVRKNKNHIFSATNARKIVPLKSNSFEEFIAEHYWGYSTLNASTTVEFEVRHPKWNVFKNAKVQFDCDLGVLFGKKWSFLNDHEPLCSFVADGSEVSVSFPNFLKF
jgi:uncharacterized protein YqjF (DUF2071 family)